MPKVGVEPTSPSLNAMEMKSGQLGQLQPQVAAGMPKVGVEPTSPSLNGGF